MGPIGAIWGDLSVAIGPQYEALFDTRIGSNMDQYWPNMGSNIGKNPTIWANMPYSGRARIGAIVAPKSVALKGTDFERRSSARGVGRWRALFLR